MLRAKLVILIICTLVTMTGVLLSENLSLAAAKPIMINAVSAWPIPHKANHWYQEFIKEVNRRAGGRLEIKLLGGPEVVNPFEHFEAMRTGIIDMTQTSSNYFAGECIEGTAANVIRPDPNFFPKIVYETKILDIINEAYAKKSKVRLLGFTCTGRGFNIFSAKPITRADLSGLKIRTMGGQTTEGVKALGGSPVTLPTGEIFTAVQRGVVDGVIRVGTDAIQYGERGIYKFVVEPRIFFDTSGPFFSLRAWDPIPDDLKKTIEEIARKISETQFPWWWADATASLQTLVKEDKIEIIRLPDTEVKKLANAFRSRYLNHIAEKSSEYGPKLKSLLEKHTE